VADKHHTHTEPAGSPCELPFPTATFKDAGAIHTHGGHSGHNEHHPHEKVMARKHNFGHPSDRKKS
jgi:hypothetical protein